MTNLSINPQKDTWFHSMQHR